MTLCHAGKVSFTKVQGLSKKGIHSESNMCLVCSWPDQYGGTMSKLPNDLPTLLETLAGASARPRYAFMVLNLIAQAGGSSGRAGPYVAASNGPVLLRDWLCDALTPMGQRDPKRIRLAERIRGELIAKDSLPDDPAEAARMVDDEVRDRVRASGKTNVSHCVTELVGAGLIERHYQGYRVDHRNRGAQRQAVYTVPPAIRAALAGTATVAAREAA